MKKNNMVVKEMIEKLKKFPPNMEFVVSSDEELNVLRSSVEVAELEGENRVVVYGLTGSEEYL